MDPAAPILVDPAARQAAALAELRTRVGALERRQFNPSDWGIPPALLAPEPSRRVGNAGQPAFGAGWSHYFDPGSGTTLYVEFYKTVEGLVALQGIAGWVGAGASGTIFTLPAGYAPPRECHYPGQGTGGAVVIVDPAGNVRCAVSSGGIAYLNGVVWRV